MRASAAGEPGEGRDKFSLVLLAGICYDRADIRNKGGMGVGFIRKPLDVKLLVLYIMSRVAAPISFDALTELVMSCEAIDYFLFAQEVGDLVASGHLALGDDGLYTVTERGRTNSGIMEDSISSPIRGKANRALADLNAALRRDAQVTAQVVEESEGRCRVELGLADDAGSLFSLSLEAPSKELGEKIVRHYHDAPEDRFNAILSLLLQEPGKEEQ